MTVGDFAQLVIAATVTLNCYQSWRAVNKAEHIAKRVEDVKHDVTIIKVSTNSMKDALVAATAKASHAEGMAEGIASQKET